VRDKLEWHFGALIGVGAVAVAAESMRLREDASHARGWEARPFLVIGAGLAVAIWTWGTLGAWGTLDLRTLNWARAFERADVAAVVAVLPFVLMLGASIVGMARGEPPWRVPWKVASWTALVIAVPAMAFTLGVLLADTAKSSSWTLARQNLAALHGDAGCGLADSETVALPDSVRAADPQIPTPRNTPAWVPPALTRALPALVLSPTAAGASRTSWLRT